MSAASDFSPRTCYFEPVLPSIATHETISRMISPWGAVESATFPCFWKSSELKGYAFITLESEAQMHTVCKALAANKVHIALQALSSKPKVLQLWKHFFSVVRSQGLPSLSVMPKAEWVACKRQWSAVQRLRPAPSVSNPGCLARLWGLPPGGLPYASVRTRLAELGRVAYLDYPHSSDASVQHTYPPAPAPSSTHDATNHTNAESGTPVPMIPPGQALVRFMSPTDRSDALYICRHVPLLVQGHALHLLPTSTSEENKYIQTATAKQQLHSVALADRQQEDAVLPGQMGPRLGGVKRQRSSSTSPPVNTAKRAAS